MGSLSDVSGSGIQLIVSALPSYPTGISVTAFADDSDPLDVPEMSLAEVATGVNGDLVVWRSPKPLLINISVIANTAEDKALSNLLDLNRVAKNKISIKDIITMTAIYPDGSRKVLTDGVLLSGTPINGVSSNGRIKGKTFKFAFGGKI